MLNGKVTLVTLSNQFFFFFTKKEKKKKKEDKQPLSLPLQSFGTSGTSFKSHSYNYKDPIEEGKL